jgi:hypothetical protein
VRAIAGFSAVPKKDGTQRKLLMQCASNYLWADASRRHDHGLTGGAAFQQVLCSTQAASMAMLDESNAFSSVLTPRWMWRWAIAPPVLYERVAH